MKMHEPIDTVFLSQAAASALDLKLASKHEIESVFKVNCLFFDHIAIGASTLLTNQLLHNYWKVEREAISKMYDSGAGTSGSIIKPVLWYQNNDSLISAAENMAEAGTLHNFSSDDTLLEHAETISSCNPSILNASEENFRSDLAQNIVEFFELFVRHNYEQHSEIDLQPLAARQTLDWLESRTKSGPITNSSIYHFSDDQLPEQDALAVKMIVDSLYHFTLSSSVWSEFSTLQSVSPIIQIAKSINNNNPINQVWENRSKQEEIEEFYSNLALDLIVKLPLSDILKLRDLQSFRSFREELGRFRSGASYSLNALQDSLDGCVDEMHAFASRDSRLQRENYYQKLKSQEKILTFRFLHGSAFFANPLALIIYTPDPVPVLWTTIFSVGLYSAGNLLSRNHSSQNTVFPKTTGEYHPTEGDLKNIEP